MEVKKSPKADLEKNRVVYLLMGYVFILAVMLVGFEWSQRDVKEVVLVSGNEVNDIEDLMPITRRTPPPPPPPPPLFIPDQIDIVDNKKQVDDVQIAPSEDHSKSQQSFVFIPQITVIEEPQDSIFINVEQKPEFKGGEAALMKYLASNTNYPALPLENGIQGRVICSFVVNKDGRITNAKVERGIDPALDREALRVINSMPEWQPGKQRGVPVRARFILPIVFRIQ